MNAPVVSSRMNLPGTGNASSGNALELRGITKMFGALAAISDVTLSVKPGEGGPFSARMARARPRCSTASPGIFCPQRAWSGFSARM